MRHSSARSPGTAAGRWLLGFMLVLLALSLAACNRDDNTLQTEDILAEYLPKDWKPLADKNLQGFLRVNIDGDKPDEWLYFFHYDNQGGNLGPIGGVIYDAQQDRELPQPAALFVPYRLLPDWREGKGQGYLGETTVAWSQARLNPANPDEPNVELEVIGTSAGGVPTRLSLFRWLGAERGYGVNHFVGNGGIVLTPTDRSDGSLVREVLTFNKLNDRSQFCERTRFVRQGDEPRFAEELPSIYFCPQAPNATPSTPGQPTYPEAVVLAWIWGGQPGVLARDNDALKAQAPDAVLRVVHVQYEGAVPVLRERAPDGVVSEIVVQTVLDTAAGLQTYKWYLVELRASEAEQTTRWRIVSAGKVE